MTTPTDLHAWFRRRLPAFVGGLLADDEERRFIEHRAECEECRRAFDDFTASDEIALTERGVHIPASMLARWPEAKRELTGIERAMVRAHLERCSECRSDLERSGHTPELEFVPALEASLEPAGWRRWLAGKPPRSGAARDAERRERGSRPRRSWTPWVLGGWATAATAAAVMLAVGPPRESLRPATALPPAAVVPSEPPRQSLVPPAPTARLRTPMRGASTSMTRIAVAEDTRYVQLMVGALELPQGDVLEAEIERGDQVLAQHVLGHASAAGVTTMFGSADQPLESGTYRLRLIGRVSRTGAAASPDTIEFRFQIARRD